MVGQSAFKNRLVGPASSINGKRPDFGLVKNRNIEVVLVFNSTTVTSPIERNFKHASWLTWKKVNWTVSLAPLRPYTRWESRTIVYFPLCLPGVGCRPSSDETAG